MYFEAFILLKNSLVIPRDFYSSDVIVKTPENRK